MTLGAHPVLVILAAAVVAPLLAELPVGRRVPIVVLEVLLGIVVGPHVLGLIEASDFVSTMSSIGVAALLFMAGMEIDFAAISGRPLTLALRGWAISAAIALLAIVGLHVVPGVVAPMMTTIALTTTGLGALMPILRDGGRLDTPFGRMALAAGTIGEVGPIVAVALALSTRYSAWQEFAFLLVFLGVVAMVAAVGVGARHPRLLAILSRTMHASSQLPVRLALLTMAALFVLSDALGLEGILGAFAAGMVVGLATRGEEGEQFRIKIDAVCFGWFTPFFFVGTGIAFDVGALTRDLETMLLIPTFLVLFLLTRGLPALIYRNDLARAELLPFALLPSVASLGLIVIITRIGAQAYHMNPDIAQALIAAGLLSSLVFPIVAGALLSRVSAPAPVPRSG
ncbi:MAG: cation:proton antiporter [Burkholderiales bacterium]